MHDLLFRRARVFDGTGADSRIADVLVAGDGIVAISEPDHSFAATNAREVINCEGLALAPGFIDVHTHDDALLLQNASGKPHPKLSQGVTTVITGNCGVSMAPLQSREVPAPLDILGADAYRFASFAEYLEALQESRPACNAASLVGHTTLRVKHVADLSREATDSECQAMALDVQAALNAGALGLSTGVYYPPARAASTKEMMAVAKPLGAVQAPITMHLRNEADAIDDALREAFAVSKAVGCPLVLSHHKLIGSNNHGRSVQTLGLIEQAAALRSVCLDCYPYDASSTMLLPERVASSRDVRITWSKAQPEAAGRSLMEMAAEQGVESIDLARRLMPAGAVYFAMHEADVSRILAHPLTMVGSDGLAHDASPHPRLWGSFTRVLGRYSREQRLFPLEIAVHKMTGLSASRFGLDRTRAGSQGIRHGRGLIAVGMAADLVLFNPETVKDQASYSAPTQASLGIERVYVNGHLACLRGETIHANSGRVLKRVPT
ncbi:MAG: N-acyl-D-amino-acid deacylase family protein [Brachymonas sp.]